MTKEEFIEKWSYVAYVKSKCRIVYNQDKECLSDFNSILRDELIKYDKWLANYHSETFVDKYLNEQR